MRRASFDRIARAVVSTTLATLAPLGLVATAGCGDDDGGVIDLEGATAPTCESEELRRLGDLSLRVAVDSVDLVMISDPSTPTVEVVESSGTHCATASSADACGVAIAAALAPAAGGDPLVGFQLGDCVDFCPGWNLVYTRGDEVGVLRDKGDVLDWLGPIDTATEAFWAAELDGYGVGCDASEYGARKVDGGWEVAVTRLTSICEPIETTQYLLSVSEDASTSVLDEAVIRSNDGCVGRRPACLRAAPARGASALGARLASLAHLEAAAVPAFATLGRELAAHHAPRSLRLASRRARADEVRHARDMRRHARRFGGLVARPSAPSLPARSLVDIAIENAREGCVREAYGAVVARYQAERAADPALRRTLTRIARDEAAHATLALRVDAWARRRLDPAARARVEAARRDALAELRRELGADDPGADVAHALGLPRPVEAQVLFETFASALHAS